MSEQQVGQSGVGAGGEQPLAFTKYRAARAATGEALAATADRSGRDVARSGMYESDWLAFRRWMSSTQIGLDEVFEGMESLGAAQAAPDKLMRRVGKQGEGVEAAVKELVGRVQVLVEHLAMLVGDVRAAAGGQQAGTGIDETKLRTVLADHRPKWVKRLPTRNSQRQQLMDIIRGLGGRPGTELDSLVDMNVVGNEELSERVVGAPTVSLRGAPAARVAAVEKCLRASGGGAPDGTDRRRRHNGDRDDGAPGRHIGVGSGDRAGATEGPGAVSERRAGRPVQVRSRARVPADESGRPGICETGAGPGCRKQGARREAGGSWLGRSGPSTVAVDGSGDQTGPADSSRACADTHGGSHRVRCAPAPRVACPGLRLEARGRGTADAMSRGGASPAGLR
jgi:hypothetical protein